MIVNGHIIIFKRKGNTILKTKKSTRKSFTVLILLSRNNPYKNKNKAIGKRTIPGTKAIFQYG